MSKFHLDLEYQKEGTVLRLQRRPDGDVDIIQTSAHTRSPETKTTPGGFGASAGGPIDTVIGTIPLAKFPDVIKFLVPNIRPLRPTP